MPSILPAARDLLCETCGYILRGLPETANCPECGRAIAHSTGEHRRLSAFEMTPSMTTLARTARTVMLRPGRFFAELATRAKDTQREADWFARGHRFVAATLLSVAACGLVIIEHSFPSWLYDVGWGRDEPEVYGVILAPVTAVMYLLIIGATRITGTAISAIARERAVRLAPAVVRRAMGFHAVHLVPAAFLGADAVGGLLSLLITPMAAIFYIVVAQVTVLLARGRASRRANGGRTPRRPFWWLPGSLAIPVMTLIVAWYFNEFGGPRFDPVGMRPANWQTYFYSIAFATLAASAYLLLTGWLAIRNIMYANDAIPHAGQAMARA